MFVVSNVEEDAIICENTGAHHVDTPFDAPDVCKQACARGEPPDNVTIVRHYIMVQGPELVVCHPIVQHRQHRSCGSCQGRGEPAGTGGQVSSRSCASTPLVMKTAS